MKIENFCSDFGEPDGPIWSKEYGIYSSEPLNIIISLIIK